MAIDAKANQGAGDVRVAFDQAALAEWMRGHGGVAAGLAVVQILLRPSPDLAREIIAGTAMVAKAHGIKGRVLRGTANSAHARDRAAAFPRLAALAREAMEACR